MKHLFTIVIAALAAVTTAANPVHAAPDGHYRTIDLGTLGGSFSQALAINNHGQVVGQSTVPDGQYHAFRYSNGVMTDLGVLEPGSGSVAFDVNDAGQVVGAAQVAQGRVSRAFLWEHGLMTDLGPSSGADLNERGQVVGSRQFPTGHHGFAWKDGRFTDLGELSPVAVNNRGWVAGHGPSLTGYQQGHVWRSGELTRLGWPAGYSEVRGINDRGHIVGLGSAILFDELHPFLWRDGEMVDLTTRGLAPDAAVAGIDNRGQIAGTVIIEYGVHWHGAIFVQ